MRLIENYRRAQHEQTYSCGTLSNKLGRSSDNFRRELPVWHAKYGLPQPLPGPGHRRWNRAEVDAWLRGYLPITAANDSSLAGRTDIARYYAARREA